MFGLLEDLTKAAVSVVRIPVGVVADAVTLGGSLTDKERPYTADAISDLLAALERASK